MSDEVFKEKLTPDDFIWGKVIGNGSFSEVFEVTCKKNNKKYAIKKVIKVLVNKAGLRKTSKLEEKALVAVGKHPFICQLYQVFDDINFIYFVLELCPNGELYQLLKKKKKLSLSICKIYAAEIVLALEELKNKKCCHRDVKPENIVLDENFHIRIIDFGTVKFPKHKNIESLNWLKKNTLSDSKSTFCGTAQYFSPEILTDKKTSYLSDLWALGVILFHMLTGDYPFVSNSPYLLFQKIQKQEISWPSNMDVNGMKLVHDLLQVDPTKRLGSGEDGFEKLKSHEFFKGIDFEKLLNDNVKEKIDLEL